MISRIGPVELIIILGIVLVIFGPKKLPQIGRALAQTIREFKGESKKKQDDTDNYISEDNEDEDNSKEK